MLVEPPLPQDIDLFLKSVNLPSLSDSQLQNLNAPITEFDIGLLIRSLPTGKSPEPNGFSNEYYRTFQPTLTPFLCSIFNQAMNDGSVPTEMLQATIVTLPKPGKSPDTPANFRPISLLNSDIKLYAKLLASWILQVLPTLVNPDQVGFIKGKQAEKAFDRIHWGFAFKTLSKFGFQGHILSAIKALYTTPSARVLANGMLSEPFTITNGTRQGSPLSSPHFYHGH